MNTDDICICTMSYDKRNRFHALINAEMQTYSGGAKHLFILHQRSNGRFPKHLEYRHLNLNVHEHNVDHIIDANWWYLKMHAFCLHARATFPRSNPICAIMDEDDRFENNYLAKAVTLMKRSKAKAVWNYTNAFVTADGIEIRKHREPVGTVVGYLDVFEYATKRACEKYPTLKNDGDPLDAQWRRIIAREFRPLEHNGLRYFIQWSGSSTRRDRTQEID